MTKPKNMKELLDRLIEVTHKENSYYQDAPVKPMPGKPATQKELQRLDACLAKKGLIAPPAYKEFLSIYNGIGHLFDFEFGLLSIQEIVTENFSFPTWIYKEAPNLTQFMIAAGNTPAFKVFDSNTPSKGEGYEVVSISPDGDEWRAKNFKEFLNLMLKGSEGSVKAEEKDRKNLEP